MFGDWGILLAYEDALEVEFAVEFTGLVELFVVLVDEFDLVAFVEFEALSWFCKIFNSFSNYWRVNCYDIFVPVTFVEFEVFDVRFVLVALVVVFLETVWLVVVVVVFVLAWSILALLWPSNFAPS